MCIGIDVGNLSCAVQAILRLHVRVCLHCVSVSVLTAKKPQQHLTWQLVLLSVQLPPSGSLLCDTIFSYNHMFINGDRLVFYTGPVFLRVDRLYRSLQNNMAHLEHLLQLRNLTFFIFYETTFKAWQDTKKKRKSHKNISLTMRETIETIVSNKKLKLF